MAFAGVSWQVATRAKQWKARDPAITLPVYTEQNEGLHLPEDKYRKCRVALCVFPDYKQLRCSCLE